MPFFDRLRGLLPGGPPKTAYDRGARALERGRLDEAAVLLGEALGAATTAREVALVRNKRAVLYVARGDVTGAVAELVEALSVDGACAAAVTTVANLTLEHGDIDEAIAHYEAAIRLDESYAPAYHNFGVALHRAGRRGDAVRMLRKATRLERSMKRT